MIYSHRLSYTGVNFGIFAIPLALDIKDMNGIFVERLIYVMKNSDNNIRQRLLDIGFETELFKPEVEEAEEIAEKNLNIIQQNSVQLFRQILYDLFAL